MSAIATITPCTPFTPRTPRDGEPRPLVTTSPDLPSPLGGGAVTYGRYVLRASIAYANDERTCRWMRWTTVLDLRPGVIDVFDLETRATDGVLLATERGHFRIEDRQLLFRSTRGREKALTYEATANRLVLRRVTSFVLDQIFVRSFSW